jgi:hypothetical protein
VTLTVIISFATHPLRSCRPNVIRYFQWYINTRAATDPSALRAANISDPAPFRTFRFHPSVRSKFIYKKKDTNITNKI